MIKKDIVNRVVSLCCLIFSLVGVANLQASEIIDSGDTVSFVSSAQSNGNGIENKWEHSQPSKGEEKNLEQLNVKIEIFSYSTTKSSAASIVQMIADKPAKNIFKYLEDSGYYVKSTSLNLNEKILTDKAAVFKGSNKNINYQYLLLATNAYNGNKININFGYILKIISLNKNMKHTYEQSNMNQGLRLTEGNSIAIMFPQVTGKNYLIMITYNGKDV